MGIPDELSYKLFFAELLQDLNARTCLRDCYRMAKRPYFKDLYKIMQGPSM